LAQFYAKKHGVLIDALREKLVHPAYAFLTANPDRVVMSMERLLEIKTTGRHRSVARSGAADQLTPAASRRLAGQLVSRLPGLDRGRHCAAAIL
jgi:hypothetical protein